MSNDILKLSVELIKKCPMCGQACTPGEGEVLETSDQHSVTFFRCDACQSSFLMNLIHYPFGVIGSLLFTDLNSKEIRKFQHSPLVDEDDVLEIHTTIHNQQVERLFMKH